MPQFPATINLSSLNGATGFTLTGEGVGNFVGKSVSSAGDINGDGYDDVLVGSNQFSQAIGETPGVAYIVYGKASQTDAFTGLNGLSAVAGAQISVAAGAFAASVGAAGDVNGDGFDDIIVGRTAVNNDAGASYVIFGKKAGLGTDLNVSALNGKNGFQIKGATADDSSGFSVNSAGDINGDGFADLIIGAINAETDQRGASYIVFGKQSGFAATIDLGKLDGKNGFKLTGANPLDLNGTSVSSAGDVNGDGLSDFLVGAKGASGNGGATYLVFGKETGFASTLDLSKLDGKTGVKINGAGGSGKSVASAGDVNGDGFDDIVIGAPYANSGAGVVHVIFGKKEAFAANVSTAFLNGKNGFTIEAETANDYAGFSVSSAGDVNGDGFDDVLIGARDAADSYAGRSYVVFGKAAGFPAFIQLANLDGNNGFKINGANDFDRSGVSVSAAGDVNRDGFADLIIGAADSDANGADSGAAHVVFGQKPLIAVNRTGTALSNVISGGDLNDKISGLAGNDTLNGYGGNDLITGGEGNDALRGGIGSDRIGGENGNDIIAGGFGNDSIWGNFGNDRLSGGVGNDIMRGGFGVDIMSGGAGSDTFDFDSFVASGVSAGKRDVILDFVAGTDKVDVNGIDADRTQTGNQDFVFIGGSKFSGDAGEIRVTQAGGITLISIDINGDKTADLSIELQGLVTLSAGDFIL